MNLVTVYQAFDPVDAGLVRSRLEAARFHPVITQENAALSLAAIPVGGILVQVPEDEADDARKFLTDSTAAADEAQPS